MIQFSNFRFDNKQKCPSTWQALTGVARLSCKYKSLLFDFKYFNLNGNGAACN